MSQRPTDDGGRDSRPAGSGVEIARWGLRAWLAGSMLVPAVIVCAVGVLGLVGLLAVAGVMATTVKEDVERNCENAIGPDPSASPTATATATSAGEPVDVTATPTANPYTSLEPRDGNSTWEAACFSALNDAPYYGPPIGTPNRSTATECAAELAVGRVGHQDSQVSLVRFVVYHTSMTSLTGYCARPPAADSSTDEIVSVANPPPASTCPKTTEAMLMPDTLAAQGVCGQPVAFAAEAISGGDLVFWDHRDKGPTRVGIAIGPTELVTVDETTGIVVQQAIPVDSDARVKRVLPEGD